MPRVLGTVILSTDEDLLPMRGTAGSNQAVEELVRWHLPRVRSLLYGMVLHAEDADDLTQEVFLRVVRGIERFDGRSSMSTWLHRIALNIARTYLAQRQRLRRQQTQHDVSTVDAPVAQCQIELQELDQAIAEALGSLSVPLRSAIVLVGIQGTTVSEAAQIAGCTTATMYWRLHQARKILKKRLSGHLR